MVTFGDCQCVKEYIRTSPEANILTYGIDEEGNSALNLAVGEKYPAVTKLLLNHGAEVGRPLK